MDEVMVAEPLNGKLVCDNGHAEIYPTSSENVLGNGTIERSSLVNCSFWLTSCVSKDLDLLSTHSNLLLDDMEKIYVTSEASQVELVTSPILWECLQMIKTEPEFRDLSYRASCDINQTELLVIYREKVTGVFPLPIEPISLTLEPTGRCLLSIPFKPGQMVTLTKGATSVEVNRQSLRALLQMVAGKGYSFCPGIPEKMLLGKACGKYVIVNRLPFKRYSAQGCPVYFHNQAAPTSIPVKPRLRSVCPRCLQVSRWLQTLTPQVSRGPTPTAVGMQPISIVKAPLSDATKLQNSRSSSTPIDSSANDCMIIDVEKSEVKSDFKPAAAAANFVHRPKTMTAIAPLLAAGQMVKADGNSLVSERQGKRQSEFQQRETNVKLSESIRQLLKARCMSKQASPLTTDGNSSRSEGGNKAKRGKNICRWCQKQFSTSSRLSRHVQRHEESRRSLKFLGQRSASLTSSDAYLRRISQGSRFLNARRGQGHISQMSLKILLMRVNSLVDEKGSHKNSEPHRKRKRRKASLDDLGSLKAQSLRHTPVTDISEASSDVIESEKVEHGLDALLVAAAGIDEKHSRGLLAPSSRLYSPFPSVVDREIRHDDFPERGEDLQGAAKKARKSLRLASKRASRGSPKKTDALKEGLSHSKPMDDALTNLDLLSTVSLRVQAAPVDTIKPMVSKNAANSSSSSPRISRMSTLAPSTSPSEHESSSSAKPLRRNSSSKAPASLPPELLRVSPPVGQHGKFPSMPALTYVPPGEVPPLHAGAGAAPSSVTTFGLSFSLPSSPTAGQQDHNIPLSVLERPQAGGGELSSADNSECGAMDLSQRKALSGRVPGSSQRDSSSSLSPAALRRLLMINQGGLPPEQQVPGPRSAPVALVSKDPPSPRALTSNKEADDNLQARIFASAKNYKMDNSKHSSGNQVQTVVAPFAGSTPAPSASVQQGKVPSSEIHCGYKWSGSGGLVKERTQMVKELVPTMFMKDILTKPLHQSPGPITSIPVQSILGPSRLEDNSISATVTSLARLKSLTGKSLPGSRTAFPESPSSLINKNLMKVPVSAEVSPSPPTSSVLGALNLSNKGRSEYEAATSQGRLTVLNSALLTSIVSTASAAGAATKPHRFQVSGASSPSIPQNNSLLKGFRPVPIPVDQMPVTMSARQARKEPVSGKGNSIISGPKVVPFSLSVMQVTPVPSTPVVAKPGSILSPTVRTSKPAAAASHSSISSPSLAAILRQPPNAARSNQDSNNMIANQSSHHLEAGSSADNVEGEWVAGPDGLEQIQIKHEPIDSESSDMTSVAASSSFSILKPIKKEICEVPNAGGPCDDSPGRVVVDMSDGTLSVSPSSNSIGRSAESMAAVLKCEFCSQPLTSAPHTCSGVPS